MAKNTQPIAKRCRALGISPAVMGYGKKTTNPRFWQDNLLTPALTAWRGFTFESLCFYHLPQIRKLIIRLALFEPFALLFLFYNRWPYLYLKLLPISFEVAGYATVSL